MATIRQPPLTRLIRAASTTAWRAAGVPAQTGSGWRRLATAVRPTTAGSCAPAVSQSPLWPRISSPQRFAKGSVGGAARSYSQSQSENKIWTFKDIQELAAAPDSEVVLIDTREPGELAETGRIPGAINIPITTQPDSFFITDEEFEDRFDLARPPRDRELVFYCKAGVRARAAAKLARDAGWTKLGEYPGSWLDWAGNGGKVQH